MASLLDSMRRLGAMVGARRKRSRKTTRRPAVGRVHGARLQGLESLEERTLLSVGPAGDERLLTGTTPVGAEPAPLNRLIVRFQDAVSLESAGSIAADLGASLVREIPSIHGAVIEINTAGRDFQAAMSAAATDWSAHPGVRYAETDALLQFEATTPNDARFSELWGMNNTGQLGGLADADIDAPEAWDIARGSHSVVVAGIDSGVDYTHPDLAANMWRNPGEIAGNGVDDDRNGWVDDVYGVDPYNGDSNPMDDHGHGTHTAGTMGAVGNNGVGVTGINWNVSIMALKIGGPAGPTYSAAVQALDYMTTMKTRYGINVVASNNSWGGFGSYQALYDAIKASNDAGILFVAAAGNYAIDNDMFPFYPASYDLPGIIAVAATDRSDRLAYFSHYGRTSVDLGAPGVDILSTVPRSLYGMDYDSWAGTSMAAPHVTGAVALGMAVEPSASADYIKQLMMNTVDVLPDLVSRTVTGGRLNLNRFISGFNRAPVLNAVGTMSLRAVQQEDITNFGTRITTMLASLGPDPITDPNVNAKEGIAVITANTTNGAWEYTTNNGATWSPMGKPTNASARLLAANTATRVRFLPSLGFTGFVAPALTFRAWDQTSGKNGGVGNATNSGGRTSFSSGTATASITVAPVNHAPVLNTSIALSLAAIDENISDTANAGTLVRDVLASGASAAIADADVADARGIAVVGADETNGFWQYWIDDVVGWENLANSVAGTPSTAQALLLPADDTTRLRFVPDPGFHGVVARGVFFRAWDQTDGRAAGDLADTLESGGKTPFSQQISSAAISVRWINEAPLLEDGAALDMTSIDEDDVSSPGTRITDILMSNFGTPIADDDSDMSPGVGIALVNADETYGGWEYTVNGSLWLPIVGALSETRALLLAADGATRLRFVPGEDFNSADGVSIPTVTFRAWDRTSGTNGAIANASINGDPTAFSTATGTISVLVNSVNDAPRLVLGEDQRVLEDDGPQIVPGWATFDPPPADETGQSVWLDVMAIDNSDLFAVEPAIDPLTGDLTYTLAPDAYGIATVTIQAGDDGGTDNGGQDTTAEQTFTITVQGVNDAPTFVLTDLTHSAGENSPRQVVPGWATEIYCGSGESDQVIWFDVTNNTNPDLFAELPAISPEGELTYRLAPDANGSASIDVVLQDDAGTANFGGDTSDAQTFEIVATRVNAAPVAFGQKLVTDANQPLAFTLTGDDGDPGDFEEQWLTFAITSIPTLGTVTLDEVTGEMVYTPNPGKKGVDRFTFTVTDDDAAGAPVRLTSNPATVEIRVDPVVQVPAGPGTNNLVLQVVRGRLQLDLTTGRTRQKLFNEPLANVQKLTVLGAAENPDQLTVSFASGGNFTLPGGLVFDGLSDGVDTLAVRGTSRGDALVVEGGRLTANELSVPFQNVGQIKLDGGAGNDSYSVAALDFPVRIADSSGVDELDFSQWTYPSGVNVNLGLIRGEPQQINGLASPLSLVGTIENVVGSPLGDVIKGNAAANRLSGGDGNDEIHGLAGNDLIFGDAGDDLLFAGAGVDALLGGLGNDTLNAGAGRSILMGGGGADVLQGGSNETIFIGGATAYDNNDAALKAIMSEWGSSRSFTDRLNRLRTGVGPNRSIYLALNATVFDDSLEDRMIGGRAKEWFLAFAGDSVENSGAGDVQGAAKR